MPLRLATIRVRRTTSGSLIQNYELLRIVNEPNSDPPFPAFPFPAPTDCGSSDSSLGDSAGEQAAYDYLSDLYLTGVQQNCTYEGTDYTGIRCEYTNLSGTSTLNTCASTSLSYYGDSDSNPGSYNGVTISDKDWQAVTCQLYLECQYAADVQTTFNYYNEIIDAVFISDSDLVTSLADDLGLSVSDSVNATALDVIQGVVQTVVWGAGSVAGGAATGVASAAFAEFLSTTTAVASDSNDLSEEITAEISDLYNELSSQLQVLTDASANGENLILQDWGRLKQVGPLTEITGYNGLGLDSDDVSSLETSATQAYSLYVMQQLVPLAYGLSLNAGENFSDFSNQPTDTQASYPTFGQTSGSWNIGAFFYGTDYPDSTVMDDIWDNGAIAFEVANGINGWAGMPLGANGSTNSNIGCAGTVITLFNLSSENVTVLASPSSGAVAAPGVQYNANEDQGCRIDRFSYDIHSTVRLRDYLGSFDGRHKRRQETGIGRHHHRRGRQYGQYVHPRNGKAVAVAMDRIFRISRWARDGMENHSPRRQATTTLRRGGSCYGRRTR